MGFIIIGERENGEHWYWTGILWERFADSGIIQEHPKRFVSLNKLATEMVKIKDAGHDYTKPHHCLDTTLMKKFKVGFWITPEADFQYFERYREVTVGRKMHGLAK